MATQLASAGGGRNIFMSYLDGAPPIFSPLFNAVLRISIGEPDRLGVTAPLNKLNQKSAGLFNLCCQLLLLIMNLFR